MDQKNDQNIVEMFLDLPITSGVDDNRMVGRVTHVEFDNKTLILFYCLTRNVSKKTYYSWIFNGNTSTRKHCYSKNLFNFF